MKHVFIMIILVFSVMIEQVEAEFFSDTNENHWVKSELGFYGMTTILPFPFLMLGIGIDGGLNSFDDRLAIGIDGYAMFHVTIEYHGGLYARISPFPDIFGKRIYLTGKAHRGHMLTSNDSGDIDLESVHTYMYGFGIKYPEIAESKKHNNIEINYKKFNSKLGLVLISFGSEF